MSRGTGVTTGALRTVPWISVPFRGGVSTWTFGTWDTKSP